MLLCLFGYAFAGTLTLDMLDVGQGDSFLVTTPNGQQILVDAGTSKSNVADTLTRMGVKKLDLLIASHPHADHIGGMRDVVERFPVGGYLHSGDTHTTRTYRSLDEAIKSHHIEEKAAKAGQVFNLGDGATMKVLWPGTLRLNGTRSDLNSNSVVLRIDNGEDCMLLMGDAEEATESAILRHNFETCDLLKVAHHGSRHSSTQRFLDAVEPKIALISSGDGNRYKHPGEATVAKLHRMETEVYRTDLTGHVTVVSTGHGLEVIDGLPDSAPLKMPKTVAVAGPVKEDSPELTPLIADPAPLPAPDHVDLPAEPPVAESSEEASDGLRVSTPKDESASPKPAASSPWQRFVSRITFWKTPKTQEESSE
jgi:competence protein ComEC